MNAQFVVVSVLFLVLSLFACRGFSASPPEPLLPVPSPEQLAWQEMELGIFCHFGMNTFYNQEWGSGNEDPKAFNPTELDAHQWARNAKESGAKYLVFTAKHHDGFCLFPSAYTKHSVESSSWRDGKGDVVQEVADACRDQGLMFGLYLSPWDRHEPSYAQSAQYDEHFKNQLREILTRYGTIGEVWFDGAGSEGRIYDWQGYYSLIKQLQPHSLIAICGPDIRWVGNEEGLAPDTLWNAQDGESLKKWYPAECDVPIRKGQWFYHTDGESNLKSLNELLDIYYGSIGRGAVLLLNVTPDRRGLFPDADAARLRELAKVVEETFRVNLAQGKKISASNVRGNDPAFGPDAILDGRKETYWAADDKVLSATIDIDLGSAMTFNRSLLQENISLGQRVESYCVEYWDGTLWKEIVKGTTIGYKRIDRFQDITATKVRFSIKKALACPTVSNIGLYYASSSNPLR